MSNFASYLSSVKLNLYLHCFCFTAAAIVVPCTTTLVSHHGEPLLHSYSWELRNHFNLKLQHVECCWLCAVGIPPGLANQKGTVMGILRSLGALARAMGPVVCSSGNRQMAVVAPKGAKVLKHVLYTLFWVWICTEHCDILHILLCFTRMDLSKKIVKSFFFFPSFFFYSLLDRWSSDLFLPHVRFFHYSSGFP